jgi:uncharacterized protein (TIGR03000 family)
MSRAWLSVIPVVCLLCTSPSFAAAEEQSGEGGGNSWWRYDRVPYGAFADLDLHYGQRAGSSPAPGARPTHAVTVDDGQAALVTVQVPANAQLWFLGQKTVQNGTVRRFITPELEAGRDYFYRVRVIWDEGGQVHDEARTIYVRAGQSLTVRLPGRGDEGRSSDFRVAAASDRR